MSSSSDSVQVLGAPQLQEEYQQQVPEINLHFSNGRVLRSSRPRPDNSWIKAQADEGTVVQNVQTWLQEEHANTDDENPRSSRPIENQRPINVLTLPFPECVHHDMTPDLHSEEDDRTKGMLVPRVVLKLMQQMQKNVCKLTVMAGNTHQNYCESVESLEKRLVDEKRKSCLSQSSDQTTYGHEARQLFPLLEHDKSLYLLDYWDDDWDLERNFQEMTRRDSSTSAMLLYEQTKPRTKLGDAFQNIRMIDKSEYQMLDNVGLEGLKDIMQKYFGPGPNIQLEKATRRYHNTIIFLKEEMPYYVMHVEQMRAVQEHIITLKGVNTGEPLILSEVLVYLDNKEKISTSIWARNIMESSSMAW